MKTEASLSKKETELLNKWRKEVADTDEKINKVSKYSIEFASLENHKWRLILCVDQFILAVNNSKLNKLLGHWRADIELIDMKISEGKHGIVMELNTRKKCLENCIKDLQKLLK